MTSHAATTSRIVLFLMIPWLTACGGSSGGSGHGSSGSVAPTSVTPPPATPTTFGGIPGRAEKAACVADARSAQEASDIYAAKNGRPAPSISALVADGELRSAPSTGHGYFISYDAATGAVTASGVCQFGG